MSLFETALSQFSGMNFAEIAGKVGLTPQQVESAIAALGTARPEPGDTAGLAAASTGLPVEKIQQLLAAIGGEAMVDRLTGALSQGGGIGGVMSGLFGKD